MASTVTTEKVNTKAKSQSKNNKKLFIIGGVALLVLAGAGYGFYYFRKRKKETGSYMGGSTGGKKSGGFSCTSKSYPLSFGTCHPDVGVLQRYLKKTYKADLGSYGQNKDGVDEMFGKLTKDAALKYLKKESFTEKDIAGMKAALKLIVR
tara:strand:- start:2721 stop:3170 length:450 start_codon:yes stop_codon:yes gene_type:complete